MKEQIEKKKLKYINTIFGGKAKIGNALIGLDDFESIEILKNDHTNTFFIFADNSGDEYPSVELQVFYCPVCGKKLQ